MISSITLRNFGKHKNRTFDLHPRVNVFCGKSSEGKSWATLRPVRWAAKNEPLGDGMRHWDGGDTAVDIVTECVRVTRGKTDKDNYYLLDTGETGNPDAVTKFKSFGRNPPEEVSRALNIDDISLQSQHDPLFMLSMKPPELARVLNDLAGLDKIDEANGRINKRLWSERQERDTAKKDVDRLAEELTRYEGLTNLEELAGAVENLQKRWEESKQRAVLLRAVVSRVYNARNEEAKFITLDTVVMVWKALLYQAKEASFLIEKAYTMRDTAGKLVEAEAEESTYSELDGAKNNLDGLVSLCEQAAACTKRAQSIRLAVQKMRKAEADVKAEEDELEKEKVEFYNAMPPECPFCGALEKHQRIRRD